jgi:addiction module HigA family antidote
VSRRSELAPPSPGEFLRELIAKYKPLTQEELAIAMRVTRYDVNQIVNGKRAVTPAMALRLAKVWDMTPGFWLNLQRAVDLHREQHALANTLATIRRVGRSRSRSERLHTLSK